MKLKVIITGATGMVGEGVLLECLQNPAVEAVLVLGRRSCGRTHAKLTEIVHADLYDISPIADQLTGYDACYFCLGTSSVGMKEPEYTKVTYTLTMGIAKVLVARNPRMTFCYVSGQGTDSTEKGRSMWARVKGKTENDLLKLGFHQVFNFRPGMMKPLRGQRNVLTLYRLLGWMFPLFRLILPSAACTLRELAQAMIEVTLRGFMKPVVEVRDMVDVVKMAKIAPQVER